jgi:hypothetical protein
VLKLKRTLLPLVLVSLVPFCAQAQDAFLEDLSIGRYVQAGVDHPVKVTVRNGVNKGINEFRVGWRWNNGPVQLSQPQQVLGDGVVANSAMGHVHPVPFRSDVEGRGVLKVWVEVRGETNRGNDTLVHVVRAITRGVRKTVLVEMKTSAGCGYCPKANALLNVMDRDPYIAVAKFHYNDPLAGPAISAYFDQYTTDSFTPAGIIDQGDLGGYTVNTQHSRWSAQVAARSAGLSPVMVNLLPVYDPATRRLTVELQATFSYAEPGEYTVNAFIIEDGVEAGEGSGEGDQLHYQAVRAILGGPGGSKGAIPASPVAGTTYSQHYGVELPRNWNPAKVRVVGLVTRCEDGLTLTLNAARSRPVTAPR